VPNQVLYFRICLLRRVADVGIDDAELALLLEGVVAVDQHEQHTPQHPDIHSVVHWVF